MSIQREKTFVECSSILRITKKKIIYTSTFDSVVYIYLSSTDYFQLSMMCETRNHEHDRTTTHKSDISTSIDYLELFSV